MTNPIFPGLAANSAQSQPVARSFRKKVSSLWSKIIGKDATAMVPQASGHGISMRDTANSYHLLVARLIPHLQSPNLEVKRSATRTLLNLALHQDNQVALRKTRRLMARLITNLQSSDVEVKRSSTQALLNLALHQDNQVALRKTKKLVAALITNLQSSDVKVQRYATVVLSNLATHQDNQVALRETHGLVAALIANLQSTSDVLVQQYATMMLSNLAAHQDNQVALRKTHGLVTALITLLQSPNIYVQRSATRVLLCLALHKDNQVALRETHGLVAALITLLQSPDVKVQRSATRVLLNLTQHQDNLVALRETHGLAEALITNLQSPDVKVQRSATGMLLSLAFHQDNQVALRKTKKLVAGLITNLQSPDVRVQLYATVALLNLATHQDNQAALREAHGLVAGLIANLQSPDVEVQQYAARALLSLNVLLNTNQSTHTESAHSSASENARYLQAKFESTNLDEAYSSFCQWIKELPIDNAQIQDGYANQSFKNNTAKDWIENPPHLDHKDQFSGVSVKEFLALFWTAANDADSREAHLSKNDAIPAIIEVLYEIRRGGNLDSSDPPKDDGSTSSNICAGGTFNKISEKLVSIISGTKSVTINLTVLITSITATIKLEAKKLRERDQLIDAQISGNEETLTEDVWNTIKNAVFASIKDEFKAFPVIAGKTLEAHISQNTDYTNVVQYISIS